jgi:hypothetical protein
LSAVVHLEDKPVLPDSDDHRDIVSLYFSVRVEDAVVHRFDDAGFHLVRFHFVEGDFFTDASDRRTEEAHVLDPTVDPQSDVSLSHPVIPRPSGSEEHCICKKGES